MSLEAASSERVATARRADLASLVSTRARAAVCVGVIGIAALLAHVAIVTAYKGPWIFDDELGYQKLAQSLAATGHFALFGKTGLTYSPLYPVILAPLYWLHLDGTQVYAWSKVVNCVLMALSVLPVYKIARFVLTPGRAVVATALSAIAPLMLYSNVEMSENVTYPVALFAVWAALVAIREPSWKHDALVVALCVLAVAARIQLVVILPAVFVAVVLEAALRTRRVRAVVRTAGGEHWLLAAATGVGALLALAAYVGTAVLSVTGQYSEQRGFPSPPPLAFLHLVAAHLAGIDMALGIIPFAGTLAAAYLWVRGGRSRDVTTFAALALSLTAFLVVLVAYTAYGNAHAYGSTDLPRIHERYLIYVLPLFIIAMVATTAFPRSRSMLKLGLAAGLVAGLLPIAIPYRYVINGTVAADTFGLTVFVARAADGGAKALQHATVAAVVYALCLGLVYALARPNTVLLVVATAGILLFIGSKAQTLMNVGARAATAHTLPATRHWVDAAGPTKGVVVLENARRQRRHDLAVAETAFYNLSISRLYYVCTPLLFNQFGEIKATIARGGTVTTTSEPLRADYVVAPQDAGVVGRVVAADRPGRLVLVRPENGVLRIAPAGRRAWACAPPRRSSS
jgi:hypothetical protein